ncbi:MAG: lysophospholipid acyltransferase family protein [Hasllibacter sp.]
MPYDKTRLSYAGTFHDPRRARVIRALEWGTGKWTLIRRIRRFEAMGAPHGQAFWPKALAVMGIEVGTPAHEVARIPRSGPLVIVANHPHGLVDGMVLAELIGRVRTDYQILTRSLLTGVEEIERFMIPVPFPHEPDAQAQLVAMRKAAMARLAGGGCVALFPSGGVAASRTAFGPAEEGAWSAFTAKMIQRSGATVLPIRFTGQNSRAYQIANRLSPTLRQGLLIHEIARALDRPIRPVIGAPVPPEAWRGMGSPSEMMAALRARTLALRPS